MSADTDAIRDRALIDVEVITDEVRRFAARWDSEADLDEAMTDGLMLYSGKLIRDLTALSAYVAEVSGGHHAGCLCLMCDRVRT